jgi:hypothetical protein
MSILERGDEWGRLRAVTDETVVVLPRDTEPSSWCDRGCRPPYLCGACADAVRIEAISWLQGLADDHFGVNPLDVIASGVHMQDMKVLWRDSLGVVTYADADHKRH